MRTLQSELERLNLAKNKKDKKSKRSKKRRAQSAKPWATYDWSEVEAELLRSAK